MSMEYRHVKIKDLKIGQNAPVRVESMLKEPLSAYNEALGQCKALQDAGCELLRVAFPHADLKGELSQLNIDLDIPVMADIHFDPDLAIAAIDAGCPAIRINPGNMPPFKLQKLIEVALERDIVIRVGANSGSINYRQLLEAQGDRALALVIAVEEQLNLLLKENFGRIILSAKSTDVKETVRANLMLSEKYPHFPLHIGITEAGPGITGLVRSAAGIGLMLAQGVGNTIRVSLTGDPVDEVEAGYEILRTLGLREHGVHLISCPTCGRRRIDVASIVERIKPFLKDFPDGLTVAVMGCEVNGPQEAKSADIGIAGSPSGMILFTKGHVVGECSLDEIPHKLVLLVESLKKNREIDK